MVDSQWDDLLEQGSAITGLKRLRRIEQGGKSHYPRAVRKARDNVQHNTGKSNTDQRGQDRPVTPYQAHDKDADSRATDRDAHAGSDQRGSK
jgi:hypothetical protein